MIQSSKLNLTTSQVEIKFYFGSILTATEQATLLDLGGGIVILSYEGETGFSDGGSGNRNIVVDFSAANIQIWSSIVNSHYTGMSESYMTYTNTTNTLIDNYVYKPNAAMANRYISFMIIGKKI